MHSIEMTYTGKSSHFEDTKIAVSIERDGSLEHAIDAFRSFLIAMGFKPETIDREVLKPQV